MPRFDKTGPRGLGPKTGRGFGPCIEDEYKEETDDIPEKVIKKILGE